jgi:imidazole glycerol-phosphate synthase subunit HisH
MTINLNVGLVDFGSGNLLSVINAIEQLGHSYTIIESSNQLQNLDCLVIPGVGSFNSAMKNLSKRKLIEPIIQFSREKYILGICLGMQLFSEVGFEGEKTFGLGLLKSQVVKFRGQLPVPHVGWNSVKLNDLQLQLFEGIEDNSDFYFTHSFYLENLSNGCEGVTSYGIDFPSVVVSNNVIGVQFHPEKSGKKGLLLLSNFFKYYVKN